MAASEPPKTKYIYVRAYRGQTIDSHSLAERVREKISERMKYLQDLVPGCNNIVGKAGVLDEIINYVQSLQKQVEINLSTCSTSILREMSSELLKSSYSMFSQLQPEMHFDQVEPSITTNLPESGFLQKTISVPVSVPGLFSETYFDRLGRLGW